MTDNPDLTTAVNMLHAIPNFDTPDTSPEQKAWLQEYLLAQEYDDDFCEEITQDFCTGFSVGRNICLELMNEIKPPYHLNLMYRVPYYQHGTRKMCRRKIKSFLSDYNFSEDELENLTTDFFLGFSTARDCIIEILKKAYWDGYKEAHPEYGG